MKRPGRRGVPQCLSFSSAPNYIGRIVEVLLFAALAAYQSYLVIANIPE